MTIAPASRPSVAPSHLFHHTGRAQWQTEVFKPTGMPTSNLRSVFVHPGNAAADVLGNTGLLHGPVRTDLRMRIPSGRAIVIEIL